MIYGLSERRVPHNGLNHSEARDLGREAGPNPTTGVGWSDVLRVILLRPLEGLPAIENIKLSIFQVVRAYLLAQDCHVRVEARKQGENNVV